MKIHFFDRTALEQRLKLPDVLHVPLQGSGEHRCVAYCYTQL